MEKNEINNYSNINWLQINWQLNKIKSFNFKKYPFHFFQLITNKDQKIESDIIYYKLNEMLRREDIDFKLKFINLIDLNESKINAICEAANIVRENLYKINYLITNENGEVINNTTNFSLFDEVEKIKNFIKGFKVINNKEDLRNFILNVNEESVSILVLANNSSFKGINNYDNKDNVKNSSVRNNDRNFGIYFLENFFREIISEKNFNFRYKEKVFNLLRYDHNSNNNNTIDTNITMAGINNNENDNYENNLDIKANEILVFLNKDFYNLNKKFLEFYSSINLDNKSDSSSANGLDNYYGTNSNNSKGSIIIKIDENLSISIEKYFPKLNKICGFNYILSEKEKESFYESTYFKYMLLNENKINDNENEYDNNNNNDIDFKGDDNINKKALHLIKKLSEEENKNMNKKNKEKDKFKDIDKDIDNNNNYESIIKLDKDYKIVLRFIHTSSNNFINESNNNNGNNNIEEKEKEVTRMIIQNFLKDLILINKENNNRINNNNNISLTLTNTDINKINTLKKIIKRSIFTNNIPIAIQNKLNLYKNKDSILIIYLNKYNIKSNPDLNYNKIKQNLIEIIEGKNQVDTNNEIESQINSQINCLNKLFPNKNFLITSNQKIFSLFNFLNSEKENISIRHLDYSKYVKYNDDLSGNYSIFQIKDEDDLFAKIKNLNKNLIFNYKANFADFKEELNKENLIEFLNLSEKNKLNSYLENYDIYTNENNSNYLNDIFDDDTKIVNIDKFFSVRNLNSNNFEEKILKVNKNRSKYVLLFNNECIGCKKIESIIDDILNKNIIKNNIKNTNFNYNSKTIHDINNIEVYKYNTLNENYCFKKFRNVPAFLIMKNGVIEKEVDLMELIRNNEDHDKALRDFFEKNLI
jgi:hypothetical protein